MIDWLTLAGLIPIVILFSQGISCVRRHGAPPWIANFGGLALMLSSLGALQWLLLLTGTVVVSPEFALIIVQGELGGLGVYVLIAA